MKNQIFTLMTLALVLCSAFVNAQAPAAFKYQTVIRDASGQIMSNQAVEIGVAIKQGSETGTTVFYENHAVTTNDFGLVNLEVGTVDPGAFSTIDWSAGPYFIQTSVDGTIMGTSQLLSVPYAHYTKTADSLAGGIHAETLFGPGNIPADLSCPAIVGSLGMGGGVLQEVAVSGDYAYITDGHYSNLEVMDISDPYAPIQVWSMGIGYTPTGIAISDNYAYVVDSETGDLMVIDISNPAIPIHTVSLGIGTTPIDIAVSGNYAYVIDIDIDDLKVINISDPEAPYQAGSMGIGSYPVDVAVSGNYAYIVDSGTDDLRVIDISNPAVPVFTGSLGIGVYPRAVALSGNYAYVVNGEIGDLKVIDISNPAAPSLTGSLGIGLWPRAVTVSSNYAYVVDIDSDDLKVIDISDPIAPSLVSSLGIGSFPRDLAISGNYAYVIDTDSDDLKVIELLCPDATVVTVDPLTGALTYTDPTWVEDEGDIHNYNSGNVGIGTTTPETTLHVIGGFKFEDGTQEDKRILTTDADGNASWQDLDAETIFGPGNIPVDLSCMATIGYLGVGFSNLSSVAVSGNYAYTVDNGTDELGVIDISNLAAPTMVGSLGVGPSPRCVVVSGNYAYVVDAESSDMKVINISDPEAPYQTGSLGIGQESVFIAVSGNYAYVVDKGSDELKVIDISNPVSPSLTGSLIVGSNPLGVAVSDSYAYIVDQTSDGLKVIDISNPVVPSLVGSLEIGPNSWSVAISGNYAYIVDVGNDDLKVIDISDPVAPTLAGSLVIGGWPSSVAITGNFSLVVDHDSNDLKVIDISNPASPFLAGSIGIGETPVSVAVSGNYAYVVDYSSNDFRVVELFCSPAVVTVDPSTGALTYTDQTWIEEEGDIHNNNFGNVGIGTNTPDTTLHVIGGFKYQDGTQEKGMLLTSDSTGNVSWQKLSTESILGSGGFVPEDLSCMNIISSYEIGTYPNSMALSGDFLYVVDPGTDDLKVIDIGNPITQSIVGVPLGIGPEPTSMAISGNFAYVVDEGSDDLKVINISDPTSLSIVGVPLGLGPEPSSVAILGNFAYVVDLGSQDLKVIDISNPASPFQAGSWNFDQMLWPISVAVQGNYAYVVFRDGYGIKVINISNPENPIGVDGLNYGSFGTWASLAIEGNYVYVVTPGEVPFAVIDISNPEDIFLASNLSLDIDTPRSIFVLDSYAYVADFYADNLKIIDVSNPLEPNLIDFLEVESPLSVIVSGNYAYVGRPDYLRVVQLYCTPTVVMDPLTGNLTLQPLPIPFETDPQVGAMDISMIPVWNGNSLVSGNIWDPAGGSGTAVTGDAKIMGRLGVGDWSYSNVTQRIKTTSEDDLALLVEDENDSQLFSVFREGGAYFSDHLGVGGPGFADVTHTILAKSTDNIALGVLDDNNSVLFNLSRTGGAYLATKSDQLWIDGPASGLGSTNTSSYPLYVSGAQQGITIHLNTTQAKTGNNFLFFIDNSYIRGSVAGQSLSDLHDSWEFQWFQSMAALDEAFILAEGVACGTQLDAAEVIVMGAQGALIYAKWAENYYHMESNVGVVYQSNAGDYAEWLEKEDPSIDLIPGTIVGIQNGLVSTNTKHARQILVISTAPMILGNTPPPGREADYEKVAFMGQVPVRVRGSVYPGDYILATGNNDGVGVSNAPDQMLLEDYDRVVGVAWSSSDIAYGETMVNVAVGLNTNDLLGEVKKQQTEVRKLRSTVEELLSYLKEKDPNFDIQLSEPAIAMNTPPNKSPKNTSIGQKEYIPDPANLSSFFEKNQDILDNMLNQAREIWLQRGNELTPEWDAQLFGRQAFMDRLKTIRPPIQNKQPQVPIDDRQEPPVLKVIQEIELKPETPNEQ